MHVLYKILPLTGFKLWTSGVRNNHSAICAKHTAQALVYSV